MKALEFVKQFIKEEEGLTTVEYAIAGALVGAAVIVSFEQLGITVGEVIDGIEGEISPDATTTTTTG